MAYVYRKPSPLTPEICQCQFCGRSEGYRAVVGFCCDRDHQERKAAKLKAAADLLRDNGYIVVLESDFLNQPEGSPANVSLPGPAEHA